MSQDLRRERALERERDSARAWAVDLEQQLAEKSRQLADLQHVTGIPLHIGSIPMEEVGQPQPETFGGAA